MALNDGFCINCETTKTQKTPSASAEAVTATLKAAAAKLVGGGDGGGGNCKWPLLIKPNSGGFGAGTWYFFFFGRF